MSYFKNFNSNATIPKSVIKSHRLSNGAFRLYVYLLQSPEFWEAKSPDIQETLHILDPKTIAKYIAELVDLKLINREYVRDSGGKLTGHLLYIIKQIHDK